MGIEQHFVALARVSHQPERATGAQLQVRHLDAPVDAADDQALFAPVKLKRFAQVEFQRHKGMRVLAFTPPPVADEIGDAAVTARISVCPDLNKQRLCRAPVLLDSVRIGIEGQDQSVVELGQLAGGLTSDVRRGRGVPGHSEPLAQRVARQARALRNFMQRQFVAQMHTSNLSKHFHGDHLFISRLKIRRE